MLIDAAFFREFNSVDDNIESRDIDKKIFRAERKLKFLLGSAFYAEIIAQFEAQTDMSGFSADNLSLYDPYIKEFLAAEAFVLLLSKSTYAITRSGLRTFVADTDEKVDATYIADLVADAKREADQFKNALISFIISEKRRTSTKYSLYTECASKLGTGFSITAVKKYNTTDQQIDNQVLTYGHRSIKNRYL